MSAEAAPPAFAALLPLFFAAFWWAICRLIARTGGWARLAETHRAERAPSGPRFRLQSGKVGSASYSGCLTVAAAPEGLHLSVLFPFRPGHPPLLIPWNVLHVRAVRRALLVEFVEVEVGAPPLATLQLEKRVFEGRVPPRPG